MKRQWTVGVALCLVTFSGCIFGSENIRTVEELGPSVLRLGTALQGVAARPDLYGFPEGGSGALCLKLATEDDPRLLEPFLGYTLFAQCAAGQAMVLVCDDQAEEAYLEDVGCTANLDRRAWEEADPPCAFTLSPETVCAQ